MSKHLRCMENLQNNVGSSVKQGNLEQFLLAIF